MIKYRLSNIFILLCLPFFLHRQNANAQDSLRSDLEEMTLEELLNLKVTVAGKTELAGDAPGIVTVITPEEIRYSGARDLLDVLRKVPGLDFAQDVEGVIGAGVRGLWAQEGKVLLLIDGLEMQENIYSTLQFLQHYPIINIKQIEIIRGAGSVIYGGNAELAVINIITKKGEDLKGLVIGGQYGRLDKINGRQSLNLSVGNQNNKGLSFDISAFYNEGNGSSFSQIRSDTNLLADFADSSLIKNLYVNAHLAYKEAELRCIYDDHSFISGFDNFGYSFKTFVSSFKKPFHLGKKLIITPFVWDKIQLPWNYIQTNDSSFLENFYTRRAEARVTAEYNFDSTYSILVGARYQMDQAKYNYDSTPMVFSYNGTNQVQYNNIAAYLQAKLNYSWAQIIPGLRFEKHNVYGAVIVPRINITKRWKKWNFDLQYNEAFRAPSVFNIDLNPGIKPEHTYDKEIEIAYRVNPYSQIGLTLFHIDIKDPIVYSYSNGSEFYLNESRTGSIGTEMEYRFKKERHQFSVNHSFYMANKNKVSIYEVPGKSQTFVAFPNHKVVLNYGFFTKGSFFMQISSVFYSQRYGFNAADSLYRFKEQLLIAPSVGWRNLFNHLDVLFAVNDLLDVRYSFVQAYRSGSDPLPGPGREFSVKIRYLFSFQSDKK